MIASDNLLIRQLNQGNEAVFEAVYKQYYPRLVAFAQGYLFDFEESKELVQKFFVQLWLNASSLRIETSLKSYLFSSIRNRCINHIRDLKVRDKNQLLYIEATLRSEQIPKEEPDQPLEKELWQEIEKLPDQIREIIILKYFKGKKQREIALALGVSENTVKTQLSRGKRKLWAALQKKFLILPLSSIILDLALEQIVRAISGS